MSSVLSWEPSFFLGLSRTSSTVFPFHPRTVSHAPSSVATRHDTVSIVLVCFQATAPLRRKADTPSWRRFRRRENAHPSFLPLSFLSCDLLPSAFALELRTWTLCMVGCASDVSLEPSTRTFRNPRGNGPPFWGTKKEDRSDARRVDKERVSDRSEERKEGERKDPEGSSAKREGGPEERHRASLSSAGRRFEVRRQPRFVRMEQGVGAKHRRGTLANDPGSDGCDVQETIVHAHHTTSRYNGMDARKPTTTALPSSVDRSTRVPCKRGRVGSEESPIGRRPKDRPVLSRPRPHARQNGPGADLPASNYNGPSQTHRRDRGDRRCRPARGRRKGPCTHPPGRLHPTRRPSGRNRPSCRLPPPCRMQESPEPTSVPSAWAIGARRTTPRPCKHPRPAPATAGSGDQTQRTLSLPFGRDVLRASVRIRSRRGRVRSRPVPSSGHAADPTTSPPPPPEPGNHGASPSSTSRPRSRPRPLPVPADRAEIRAVAPSAWVSTEARATRTASADLIPIERWRRPR